MLVVDDNATNRRILEEMLANWGMRPTASPAAREALGRLATGRARPASPIRLVLTDAHMPEMDGFDAGAHASSRIPSLASTVIMMLTSGDRPGDIARCEELGIAAYLLKPVKQSELFDAIMLALGVADGRPRDCTRPPPRCPAVRPLRILLAEDSLVNQKLAVGLLDKQGHAVTVANNGREAVAALETQPFDLVLMDVQMPEMDGLEATAAIRAARAADRRPRADHRHDRPRHEGRPRALPGGRHGRLRRQADPRRRAVGGPGRRCGRFPDARVSGTAAGAGGRSGQLAGLRWPPWKATCALLREVAHAFLTEAPRCWREYRRADQLRPERGPPAPPTRSREALATSAPPAPSSLPPNWKQWPQAET